MYYNSWRTGSTFILNLLKNKIIVNFVIFVVTGQKFSPSFVTVIGSGINQVRIRDPRKTTRIRNTVQTDAYSQHCGKPFWRKHALSISIGFSADPDPGFWVNVDLDPDHAFYVNVDPNQAFDINADPHQAF